ncbi:MAG: class B sortase [Oscillospiraceae bacterium]|jgi:sortase B|nr:class B sortase [Oscillospiraceae bacterium]
MPSKSAIFTRCFLCLILTLLLLASCGQTNPGGVSEVPEDSQAEAAPQKEAFVLSDETKLSFAALAENKELLLDREKAAEQVAAYYQDKPEIAPVILGEDNVDGKLEQPDFSLRIAAAAQRNPDTVGWFRIKDTNMNYAVVQDVTDVNYYTERDYDKGLHYGTPPNGPYYDLYGVIWLGPRVAVSSRAELSPNTVMFGHNWYNIYAGSVRKDSPNDIMLGQSAAYIYPEWAEEHPFINFSIKNDNMTWVVYASFFTEDSWPNNYSDIDFNYVKPDLSPEQMERYVKEINERALYTADFELSPEDNVMTISTCSWADGRNDGTHRFVILAKLLDEGAPLPEVTYTVNPNPKHAK